MLRVRDIMSKDVFALTPDTSVRQAIEQLAKRHLSGAPVISGRDVVGVISSNDLLAAAATTRAVQGVDSQTEDLSDYYDANTLEIPEDDTGAEEMLRFYDDSVAELSDIVESPGLLHDDLDDRTIGEIMTQNVIAIGPEAPLTNAAIVMMRNRIHRVLVIDRGSLIGIMTATDLLRTLADHRIGHNTFTFGPPRPQPVRSSERRNRRR